MNSKSIVNLDIIDQRVYKALIVGSIIGVIINLYYTIFFAFLGATVLSLINFFGIFIYSFVYYLVKNGSVKLPYLAVVSQIVVSCVLSSFYLGTESWEEKKERQKLRGSL